MSTSEPPLESVTGARQTLAVIVPVRLAGTPPWAEGPYPFELGSRRTDTAARAVYFAPASARVLYGTQGRPCRWHRAMAVDRDGLRLVAAELLRTATARDPQHALAVFHFDVECALLPVLRAVGHRASAGPDPLTGDLSLARLLDGVAELREQAGTFAVARPYTVVFLTPTAAHTPALRPGPTEAVPQSADRWLWQLTSRSTPADFPLAPETEADEYRRGVRISADWSAMVLRHGAAFLGHRADTGDDSDFYAFGALHARTVYLDALLLGALQRDHVDELTDELSAVFHGARLTRRVTALERSIARFRSAYWRQHLTAHGPANELLRAFQDQYRLPARFAEILAEAADYSRLAQTQENQQIGAALGLLTVLGLPLGTALGILQVLGDSSVRGLLIALGLSVAATAAALTTRYGRLVLSSLRAASDREEEGTGPPPGASGRS